MLFVDAYLPDNDPATLADFHTLNDRLLSEGLALRPVLPSQWATSDEETSA